ncbi:MAG: glucose-6-phosphate isomerase, partial [Xanthobacteraceae bacterium]
AVALKPILEKRAPNDVPAAVGAALSVAIGKPIAVMMAYADRLERFTRWYVQLWAESLGKDGKGTTPIAARGPVDQHSQLQLFIAGPRDKLFTIITTAVAGRGPRIAADLATLAGEPDFAGKTFGDLVAAQGRATAETLAKNGCPVRTIYVEKLDEQSLGELLMHFMLETIIAAHLLGVDPFDQPAVEEGKILAKQYLKG